jgi:fructan beta-fructosidase
MPGLLLLFLCCAADRPDVVLADFEGDDYGGWTATGAAFGKGPARGTLPGQMPVTGFKGKGLANSFLGGDRPTGTLTSPEFKLDRRYVSFLIGGGGYPGETCINLLVGGKAIRTATGPNTEAGGSEQLEPAAWDVADLAGKVARIEIVDKATGGWGHINIDHIVLTDTKPDTCSELGIVANSRYLYFPVKTGAPKRRVSVSTDEGVWREFDIELTDGPFTFRALLDITPIKGKIAVVRIDRVPTSSKLSSNLMDQIGTCDTPHDSETIYKEKQRPQFHFTSKRGWLNDPNGLVHHNGEWHLFYQHNPYGWNWGNMHWGHAVSKDLVRWKELPVALYPKRHGDWAFSGSAWIDPRDRSLRLAYTSTARGECLAVSHDGGRTWRETDGNPVVRHQGRDPKVLWHPPSKRWVMAVYDEHAGKRWIAFWSSPDMRKWTFESRIEGFFECPDLFELPVAGSKERRWVLYGADGQYVLGDFDGKAFKKTSGKHRLWWGNFYAAQTYSDAPDDRRVQVGWGQNITFPGAAFNQQMTFPVELTLRTTPDGPRMFAEPVKEIATLHRGRVTVSNVALGAKGPSQKGELFDLRAVIEPGSAAEVGFRVRGEPVAYDVKKQALVCKAGTIPLKLVGGKVRLRLLVDRGSVEVFANDGAVAVSIGAHLWDRDRVVEAFARGGTATLEELDVAELRPARKE